MRVTFWLLLPVGWIALALVGRKARRIVAQEEPVPVSVSVPVSEIAHEANAGSGTDTGTDTGTKPIAPGASRVADGETPSHNEKGS